MSAEMVTMFLSVREWIAKLQQQSWSKLTESCGLLAAKACGLKFNTFRKYITGNDRQKTVKIVKKRYASKTQKIDVELLASIRVQISRWNRGQSDDGTRVIKRPPPVTGKRICTWLLAEKNVTISRPSITILLGKIGFRFGKASRRYNGHEDVGNVTYRHDYVNRMKGLRKALSPLVPKRTLVVLDESYLNENHVETKTWYDPDDETPLPTEQGAGRRLCIVGAGYYKSEQGSDSHRKLDCGWVTDSLLMFEGGADTKLGKRKLDDPHSSADGYKHNFDGPHFNQWFTKLCIALQKEHGPCDIKMDSAGYHKRNENKLPKFRKEDMKEYMREHGIVFDETLPLKNAELMSLIKQNKPAPKYVSVEIATKYGHTIIFTPPYHPELQEIEVIWAVGKNWCKAHPAQSFAELRKNAVFAFKEHVTAHTWAGVHKKVVKWENHYIAESEHDRAYVAEEAEEGDIGSESDTES